MNSVAFMHAAYIVVWVILGGYSADLVARYVKLRKELRDLKK
ncbi:CcmD family protein [Candidatus Korobacter versatilis]|nr:CcmD family protein [Candidatus Koribacter versatilis]